MSHCHAMVLVVLASALALAVSVADADVFNMPTGQTSLSFVTVGDPGNAADTTGYGAVGYSYRMGQYDVTVGQYVQFLNAVASTDTYGLYNSQMALDFPTIGISQSGSSGSYSYSVSGSDFQAANCPIFDVSWGDAARFCNWLQNGQPTGAEGPGTTETGAYTLNGDTTNLLTETRNAGATYFIPSESEWYKAAYYRGGGANAGYWPYPTESYTAPVNVLSSTGTNNANFYDYTGAGLTDSVNKLTPVGAFAASPGPYGTFDMGGDVFQWNEAVVSASYRGCRGGSYSVSSNDLASSYRSSGNPAADPSSTGFRIAASTLFPGDANGDGRVDVNDLTIVLSNFGSTGCTWSQGCMDGDPSGTVDVNDLTIVLANYGRTVGLTTLATVPEPGTLALLAAGLVGLLVSPWRIRK